MGRFRMMGRRGRRRGAAALAALALVVTGCGSGAPDPAEHVSAAFEQLRDVSAGTITLRLDGDVPALVDLFEDDSLAAAGHDVVNVLAGLTLTFSFDESSESFAVRIGDDTTTLAHVIATGSDGLFFQLDIEAIFGMLPDLGADAPDMGGMVNALSGLSGRWLHLEGSLDDLGEAGQMFDLPSGLDVDTDRGRELARQFAEVVRDHMTVTEASVDGRCGDAVRYDVVVDAQAMAELVALLDEVDDVDGIDDLDDLMDNAPEDGVSLSVWTAGDQLACVGIDVAELIRLGADPDDAEEIARAEEAAGLVWLMIEWDTDTAILTPPTDFDTMTFEELIGMVFGGMMGGFMDGMDDVGAMPGGSGDVDTYGDDPYLDGLWDDCAGGDEEACQSLFFESPLGSDYERFGQDCGMALAQGDDC